VICWQTGLESRYKLRKGAYDYTNEYTSQGLIYLRARYYDPATGRFLTKDPFPGITNQPASLHPYQYAANNPINYTDPTGHCIFGLDTMVCIAIALAGVAGGFAGGMAYHGIEVLNSENPCARWDWNRALLWGAVGGTMGIPLAFGAAYLGITYLGWWGTAQVVGAAGTTATLWPAPWNNQQVINGIRYTIHALERMMPKGLGGRGIPPSVVENALRFGKVGPGRDPETLAIIFENVRVITNLTKDVVITVMKHSGY